MTCHVCQEYQIWNCNHESYQLQSSTSVRIPLIFRLTKVERERTPLRHPKTYAMFSCGIGGGAAIVNECLTVRRRGGVISDSKMGIARWVDTGAAIHLYIVDRIALKNPRLWTTETRRTSSSDRPHPVRWACARDRPHGSWHRLSTSWEGGQRAFLFPSIEGELRPRTSSYCGSIYWLYAPNEASTING